MKDYMTKKEIVATFDSEWVLLQEPKLKKNLQVIGGKVVCHSKDRAEVYRKAKDLPPKEFAVFYTGKIPKGTAVVL